MHSGGRKRHASGARGTRQRVSEKTETSNHSVRRFFRRRLHIIVVINGVRGNSSNRSVINLLLMLSTPRPSPVIRRREFHIIVVINGVRGNSSNCSVINLAADAFDTPPISAIRRRSSISLLSSMASEETAATAVSLTAADA